MTHVSLDAIVLSLLGASFVGMFLHRFLGLVLASFVAEIWLLSLCILLLVGFLHGFKVLILVIEWRVLLRLANSDWNSLVRALLVVFNTVKIVLESLFLVNLSVLEDGWILIVTIRDVLHVLFLQSCVLEFPLFSSSGSPVSLELFHVLLEFLLPSWSEIDLLANLVRDVGKVQADHDHIRLLPSRSFADIGHLSSFLFGNILITVAIFKELFSLLDVSSNIVERFFISEVGGDLVPWSALHGLVRHSSCVKHLNCVWVIWLETEVILHVVVLLNKLISIDQLDRFEEVWKVLINLEFPFGHGETPFLK